MVTGPQGQCPEAGSHSDIASASLAEGLNIRWGPWLLLRLLLLLLLLCLESRRRGRWWFIRLEGVSPLATLLSSTAMEALVAVRDCSSSRT